MKTNILMIGAAATVACASAASAADLPVAPEPIDYVRVCDAYGAGFYYIPGTDTCLNVSGRVRAEYRGFNYNRNFREATSNPSQARDFDSSEFRARGYIYMDSRTNTEFGLLRTYTEIFLTVDNNDDVQTSMDHAYIQFGGFTFGRGQSFYDFVNYAAYASVFTPQLSDQKTNLAAYTFAFGNGFSSSVSIEDTSARRSGIGGAYTTSTTSVVGVDAAGNDITQTTTESVGYGGTKYPDLVANLRVDQGWGSAQLMAAGHQVWPGYRAEGTAESKVGFAVGGGVLFNLPFGVGTRMNVTGTYANGATSYASTDTTGFSSPRGFIVEATDASFNSATGDIETNEAWSVSGGVGTQISPELGFGIQGGYFMMSDQVDSDNSFSNVDVQGDITYAPGNISGLEMGVGLEYRYVNPGEEAASSGDAYAGFFRAERTF
ncbi:porin [Amorphus coralli]|uniref:porin n=1 Tax=Amorphus coralli TaxID=340680 RepID=UPI0003736378|nr:porin [Amorphus coralli]